MHCLPKQPIYIICFLIRKPVFILVVKNTYHIGFGFFPRLVWSELPVPLGSCCPLGEPNAWGSWFWQGHYGEHHFHPRANLSARSSFSGLLIVPQEMLNIAPLQTGLQGGYPVFCLFFSYDFWIYLFYVHRCLRLMLVHFKRRHRSLWSAAIDVCELP